MPKETKRTGAPAQQAPQSTTQDWSQTGATGFESVQRADLGIPFLAIIQKGSPQVDKSHKDYATKRIEGAETGDIMNNVSNVVVASPGEPVQFVPCSFQKLWAEWKPRNSGGGMVRAHTSELVLSECTKNDKKQDVLPNGNIVYTTAYFYGIALIDGERVPCVIGMTSSQLKKSRQWLNMMMTMKMVKPGTQDKFTPPMFSHTYLLSTVAESNTEGNWFGWLIQLGQEVKDPVLIAESMDWCKRSMSTQKQLSNSPAEDHADKI